MTNYITPEIPEIQSTSVGAEPDLFKQIHTSQIIYM